MHETYTRVAEPSQTSQPSQSAAPDPLAESLAILRRLTRQSATSWPVSDLPRRVTMLEVWSETIEAELGLTPPEAAQIMASLITTGHALHDFGRRVYPGRPITTGPLPGNAVDMTLRLDDAAASPTCPQRPPHPLPSFMA